jgi:NADH:ubiquinone oxidoreductase subunit 5 (subunit L)/multisubunit Na+/H+ antiporter MnhA subunit
MGVMIITTSGLPPFAAFFSKGLIITSVTDFGTLLQTIVLYLATAITFAYCLRMFSLVFMGPQSDHLQRQHVHEAPKVMLIPAAILAGLCCVWGLAEPLVASFMNVNLTEGLLGAFTSLETPIFLALLLPTGLIAYYSYYKDYHAFRNVATTNNPLSTSFKHAYFFDDIYSAVVKGIDRFSGALTRFENAFFGRYPDQFGTEVSEAAEPGKAEGLKKGPSDSFRNYVAAAVLGFILIAVLVILTVGGL